ncbi:hypothetical protein ACQEV4_00725 [Streptomyces shenzhenensis]
MAFSPTAWGDFLDHATQ